MRPLSRLLPLLIGLMLPTLAAAQMMAPPLHGQTLDGREFDLDRLKGRVVMVVLWRTDCAVCLDKMPELRANAQGWKDQPFDLVLVNLDARSADAEAYDRLRRQTAGVQPGLHSLWHGQTDLAAAWRNGGKLPVTLVIARDGRIAARHEGRIPPDAWNQVADLLP